LLDPIATGLDRAARGAVIVIYEIAVIALLYVRLNLSVSADRVIAVNTGIRADIVGIIALFIALLDPVAAVGRLARV